MNLYGCAIVVTFGYHMFARQHKGNRSFTDSPCIMMLLCNTFYLGAGSGGNVGRR
jgi:hypothetical protein